MLFWNYLRILFCYVVFSFLVYEEAHTCLFVVGLRVIKQVATLESGVTFSCFLCTFPNPMMSNFMLFSSSYFSSSCTCSSFNNVLTLYVAIFCRSP